MIEKNNYIQFKELNNDEIIQLFTKRPFNFNKLTSKEEITKQFQEIEKIVNYKFTNIIRPHQTHSSNIKIVNNNNLNDNFDDVDGLVTNLKNIALTTVVADCQAILLYDKKNKVIANIHSGWKGTLNKIIINAINTMIKEFNSNPKDIEAYICPSILKCCFEVDIEVVNMFKENFNDIEEFIYKGQIKDNKQKYYIDTVAINKNEMKKIGLLENNIHTSNICTMCNPDKYHSYRVDHDKSGRNLALICLK